MIWDFESRSVGAGAFVSEEGSAGQDAGSIPGCYALCITDVFGGCCQSFRCGALVGLRDLGTRDKSREVLSFRTA